MTMNFTINPLRFSRMLLLDIVASARPLIIIAASVLVLALLAGFSGNAIGNTFFGMVLFIGGVLITSSSFADLHDPRRCTAYLMLPASMLEKFLSRALLSSVGYTIAATALVWLSSCAASGLCRMMRGASLSFIDLTHPQIWKSICAFLVLQSLFLFGAVLFRKHAFIKTILGVGLLLLLLMILSGVMFNLGFFDAFRKGMDFSGNAQIDVLGNPVVNAVMKYVLPPFLWIAAFFKHSRTVV
jgi:hypothetical protein